MSTGSTGTGAEPAVTPPLRTRPRWTSRVTGAVALLLALFVVQDLARNEAFNWPVVRQYLFAGPVLAGVRMTISLTVVSMTIGLILSVVVAQMRISANPVLRTMAVVFVWLFRAVPLLVLLIVIFNIGLLYPTLGLGVPFGGAKFLTFDVQQSLPAFWAAVLAFSLAECAYGSEIVRASLLSVPRGQIEAAESLGMTHGRIMRRIVIPQALRMAVPPLANNAIIMLKGTAVVAFIAVPDLLYSVQRIYNVNYQIMPLLTVATLWYLALVSVMSLVQHRLELRFGNSAHHGPRTRKKVKG